MITIVLAEDHLIVRQGLRALLGSVPEYCLIDEAGDGPEALQKVEQHSPDVLVLDVMLPILNGLEVARLARQRSPRTQIVFLSMHANEAYVLEALRAGAAAYVLKQSSSDDLRQAINAVMNGERYLSPPLDEQSLTRYVRLIESDGDDLTALLTLREREILPMAAGGLTNAAIAGRLSLSRRTVEMHRSNLMRKLHLRSQTELVRFAIQRGIAPID